jgi:hypothetical protein
MRNSNRLFAVIVVLAGIGSSAILAITLFSF